MRTIDPDILTALAAAQLRPFQLLTLTIDGTSYLYTDCDVPLLYDGDIYSPRGFSHDGALYSMGQIVSRVSLKIDNVDQVLSPAFIGGEPQGSVVNLREVVLNDSLAIIANSGVVWFSGTIDDWSLEEDFVQVAVVGPNYAWAQRTTGRQPASCRWKVFKGDECAYAGVLTTCDRTYSNCASRVNTNNFGGFRWLPSIMGKQVPWGILA
jgi:hypothetical protein